MQYEEFPAAPALRGLVACYWRFVIPSNSEPGPLMHTVPPTGTVELVWLPGGQAMLVGPRMTALRVPVYPGTCYLGIRFCPGAAGPLLGVTVKTIREVVCPYPSAELGHAMKSSGLNGIDSFLFRMAEHTGWHAPDPVIAAVTSNILKAHGDVSVSGLVAGCGLSYRQLLRRFYEATGLTPKEFARLRRLREACVQALHRSEPGWADVSAASGFADQAHLVREFQDIYGWPPRLVHEYLRRINHVNIIG